TKSKTVCLFLTSRSHEQACENRMQNAARKRSPCSARNSCELSPAWLIPVFFASSAAGTAGDEATTAALAPAGAPVFGPDTGFEVTSSMARRLARERYQAPITGRFPASNAG